MGTTIATFTRAIRTAMTEALLTLSQWLSPSFPVGAFAYSHGLETGIASGQVHTAETLYEWLSDICIHGAGSSDLVLLKAAHTGHPLDELDVMARALCPSAERLKETDLQGAAFVQTVNAVWHLNLPALTYPVAVGAAAAAREIPLDLTARLYLQAFLANLTSAAVRLVPLGQTDGQAVIARLAPQIEQTATRALQTPLSALSSAAFAADIASMRHEALQPRIFRT